MARNQHEITRHSAPRSRSRGDGVRGGVGALATLVLLSTLVAVAGGVSGHGGIERVGVRTLIEEAPTRLRLAAAVIASAVRDLGALPTDLADDGGGDASSGALLAQIPTCLHWLHEPSQATVSDGADVTRPGVAIPDALLALPPPTA